MDASLAALTRAVFTAGLDPSVVERRWPAFEAAFGGFDPAVVAAFDDADVERLLGDAGIVRNRRKIEATIGNARTLVAVGMPLGAWLADQAEPEAALQARFTGLGPSAAAHVVSIVGEVGV